MLADGFQSLNYTYLGSELTWPIYHKGTLGKAKADLDRAAAAIRAQHGEHAAHVVALKAVVTQASSAIPVVPLYGTLLIKVEDEMGLGEGPIQQIDRLFRDKLQGQPDLDDASRIRVDDWELSDTMQAELARRWAMLTTENLAHLADLPKYRQNSSSCSALAWVASIMALTSTRRSSRPGSHMPARSPMDLALTLAEEAAANGEAPVGAVVMDGEIVLAAERNRMKALNDPTAPCRNAGHAAPRWQSAAAGGSTAATSM